MKFLHRLMDHVVSTSDNNNFREWCIYHISSFRKNRETSILNSHNNRYIAVLKKKPTTDK